MRWDAVGGDEAFPFSHRLRARFADTDAMGVVHHGAYVRYLESARTEYLRALGHPYDEVRRSGIDFSVVEVGVRFLRPLHFDEEVDVATALTWRRGATFQMSYRVEAGGRRRAEGVTVHAAVDAEGRPARLPPWLPPPLGS